MTDARPGKLPVLLTTAGMEICRLYSIILLYAHTLESLEFPLAPMGMSLLASLTASRILRQVKRRRMTEFLVHTLLFCISLICILSAASAIPFSVVRGAGQWFIFWSITIFSGIFWYRGASIGRSGTSYHTTVIRFDVGLGIILFVYVFRVLLGLESFLDSGTAGAYILFGMAALYTARNNDHSDQIISSGFSMRLMFPFIMLFAAVGAVLLILFPILTQAAESAYVSFHQGTAPLRRWGVSLILWFFGSRQSKQSAPLSDSYSFAEGQVDTSVLESGPFAQLLEKILTWSILGAVLAAVLLLALWMVMHLIRYLRGSSAGLQGSLTLRELLQNIGRNIMSFIKNIRFFSLRKKRVSEGTAVFIKFCRWGSRSGLCRRNDETPAEYSSRIACSIPDAAEAAGALVRAVHREWYECAVLSQEDIRNVRRALLSLYRPSLYPFRLACRLRLGRHSPRRKSA